MEILGARISFDDNEVLGGKWAGSSDATQRNATQPRFFLEGTQDSLI